MAETQWLFRSGDLARDGWESAVGAYTPGWRHTGLLVGALAAGDELPLPGAGVELIVVPLSGSFEVTHDGGTTALAGRASVFDGPSDVLYLGSSATGMLRGTGRVAVATAPADEDRPTQYLAAADTPVELRGGGQASRQVHNFGTPGALDASRLIVCEVITPAGNWSSYPPHKHDESIPGRESRLEEVYYFESATERGRDAAGEPFGMFATYPSPAGDTRIDGMVRTGDIALVPSGYHGPAVAAPGYDLYYLNVMAGPDPERAWLISDDPAHAWVRDTWPGQGIDPRLPYRKDRG